MEEFRGRPGEDPVVTETFSGRTESESAEKEATPQLTEQVMQVLMEAMGIVRNAAQLTEALEKLHRIRETACCTRMDADRILLAEAMLRSAFERKESRGAHQRADYPERNDGDFQKTTVAVCRSEEVEIRFC